MLMNENLNIQELVSECSLAQKNGLLHGVVIAAGTRLSRDVLWSFGDASVSPTKSAMQTDSIFDVASITKAIATASACAICIDRGLLDPKSPVRDYLPQLGQFKNSEIRVCDLATHYSGFDNRKFDWYEPEEMLSKMIETPAQRPAREQFEYSCRNFIVLGLIVEKITGEDLASFCSHNIFSPLGMSKTTFGPLFTGLEKVVPTVRPAGTISDEQALKTNRPVGNAGLFSSAHDLATFSQMLLNKGKIGEVQIFGENALAWLMRPCSPIGLPPRSFGWDMRPCSECLQRPSVLSQSAIGHGGWTGQSIWIDPELNCYIIVLTNRTHAPKCKDIDSHGPSERFRAHISDLVLSNIIDKPKNGS